MVIDDLFEKQNSQYCTFNKNIKCKQDLRNMLKEFPSDLSGQILRLWDKYSVSMNSLNEKIQSSENLINKYLNEMGY